MKALLLGIEKAILYFHYLSITKHETYYDKDFQPPDFSLFNRNTVYDRIGSITGCTDGHKK